MSANERQVGGNHYKGAGEEHWDRVARLKLDYFQGQITKYVERWKLKNGIEDLLKAQHFMQKYIELAGANMLPDWKVPVTEAEVTPTSSLEREVDQILQTYGHAPCLDWQGGFKDILQILRTARGEPGPGYVDQDR